MTTTVIRNLDEASTRVRQTAIRQVIKSLVLQYGVDDVIEGLRFIYREDVFSKARNTEAVKYRAGLLDELVDRLRKGYGHDSTHGRLLRLRKEDRQKRTRFQPDHSRSVQARDEKVDGVVQKATA